MSSFYPEVTTTMDGQWEVNWTELKKSMVKAAHVYSRTFRRRNEEVARVDFPSHPTRREPFFAIRQIPPPTVGMLLTGNLIMRADDGDASELTLVHIDQNGDEEVHLEETFRTSGLEDQGSDRLALRGQA